LSGFEKRNQRHRSPTMPGDEDNLFIVRPAHFVTEYQASGGIVFENRIWISSFSGKLF